MATIYAPAELNISKNGIKAKNKIILVKQSINTILDILQEPHPRGFIEWADLVRELEFRCGVSKLEAVEYIRSQLIEKGKLYEVPCHLSGSVLLTRDKSLLASQVRTSDEDEKLIVEQDKKYLKQLEWSVRRGGRRRRST